jgi:hypothetical protein
VTVELLPSSRVFKDHFKQAMAEALWDDVLRIQAFHFDDLDMVRSIVHSSVVQIMVISDKETYNKAKRTKAGLDVLSEGSADVRLIARGSMKGLYGSYSELMGIQHAKVLCLDSHRRSRLWVGSANFTQASEYNHEVHGSDHRDA